MHRITRSWITGIAAWAAVLFIGGAAIAGVGTHSAGTDKHATVEVEASDSESPEASEAPEASESPDAEKDDGEKADNHGQCVSAWAHKAKEGDGSLHGRFFGGFVSSVAKSDDTGADCDESELLAEWQAKQAAAPSGDEKHGKSGEKHGHAPEPEPSESDGS